MVAVKVCNQPKITEKAKLQFQQEVSILHGCHHPNVVQFKGACCWKVLIFHRIKTIQCCWLNTRLPNRVIITSFYHGFTSRLHMCFSIEIDWLPCIVWLYSKGPTSTLLCTYVSICSLSLVPSIFCHLRALILQGGKRTVLVTEYMEKGDLCSAISRASTKCSWPRLGKSLALDIARGLEFLHLKNIVHFDLKSGNILLDRYNTAKLADVGLAKILTKTHNDNLATFLATTDLGTFAWAAPEVSSLPFPLPPTIISIAAGQWQFRVYYKLLERPYTQSHKFLSWPFFVETCSPLHFLLSYHPGC